MRRALLALSLATLAVAALAGPSRAGSDPAREWFTIRTEHFAIHSYDGGEELARRAAGFLEEAYRDLNPLLGWVPEERVEVTLVDDVDAANGWASVLPYNHINLFAYPPEGTSTLGEYDDWLRLLIYHEYAHIAHIDNAEEIPRIVNTVLGKTLKPNTALPRWFTEGVATWVETRTSGAGRLHGTRFEMYLRTADLAGKLPELSEVTGTPLLEPGGSSWYMYGAYIMEKIVRERGEGALRTYFKRYGRRLIPFSLNILSRQITGKDLPAWFAEVLDEVRGRTKATQAEVDRTGGVVEGTRLTTGGEFKAYPHYSVDGRYLVWVESDGHTPGALKRAPVGRLGDIERVFKCDGGCGDWTFTPTGERVVMQTNRPYRFVNYYSELIRFPFRKGQRATTAGTMLTDGRRLRTPAFSADGSRLFAVGSAWGKTWLEAVDPHTGDRLGRWDPPGWGRLGEPVPSRDGNHVYIPMHEGGNRDLYELELASGRWRRLTYGSALELTPTLSPDGRWLVYVSDATGVFNVYARRLADGQTRRLTNVLGGTFWPSVSPDGKTLVYAGWNWEGYDLYALPFDPDGGRPVAVPDPRPPHPAREPPPVRSARQPYTPLPTMLPRSWFPTYVFDSTGISLLGLQLSGTDVTGRLTTSIGFDYDFNREDWSANAALVIGLGYPDVSLTAGRYTWDRLSFVGDRAQDYREEVWYARVSANLNIPSVIAPMSFGIGYTVDVSRALEKADWKHTPDSFQPFIPKEGFSTRFNFGFGFSDVDQPKWAITPVRGGSARFDFGMRHPSIGSDRTSWTFTYAAKRYVLMPWLHDHVLVLRGEGGWTGGERGEYSPFSLGGVPPQDLLVDLLNERWAYNAWLRGYEPYAFAGDAYHLVTAEYRFPIVRVRQGLDTLPVFFQDLHAAVFADVGVAYREPFDEDDLERVHGSVGAELRMTIELMYGYPASFRLGYARGLGPEGIDQVYLMLAPAP